MDSSVWPGTDLIMLIHLRGQPHYGWELTHGGID